MSTITIPKKFSGRDDLVAIPREEYKTFLVTRQFTEVKITEKQKRALTRAERNFKARKTLSYDEFIRELEG